MLLPLNGSLFHAQVAVIPTRMNISHVSLSSTTIRIVLFKKKTMKYLIVSVLWFRFETFSYTVLRESHITVKTVLNWLLSLITTTCYIQNFNKICCINVVAKVVDLSFSIGTTTTKVVKYHMRLRKYWILLLSTFFSGHHQSSQKLVNEQTTWRWNH